MRQQRRAIEEGVSKSNDTTRAKAWRCAQQASPALKLTFRSGRNLVASAAAALITLRREMALMTEAAARLAGLPALLALVFVSATRSLSPAASAMCSVLALARPASTRGERVKISGGAKP